MPQRGAACSAGAYSAGAYSWGRPGFGADGPDIAVPAEAASASLNADAFLSAAAGYRQAAPDSSQPRRRRRSGR